MPSIRKYNKKGEGGGGGGGGGTVVIFKISDLEHVNFASFSTRCYNGVLWKTYFLGLPSCIKSFSSRKKRVIFFQKLTQYRSMIEVYIKAKI